MSAASNRHPVSGPTLHLVGLGPGSAEFLTLRAWELLASGKPLLVADPDHEAAQTVLARGFDFEVLGPADPESVAACVLTWAAGLGPRECVYAVAGHPLEAPETGLILAGATAGMRVLVEPALSDLERMPGADPATGVAGGAAAMRAGIAFHRLVGVMARLRSPGGCPWDREQDHASLAIHLLEECHEVLDAIDRQDMVDLEEELGDLLLQVVFHAQVASDARSFEIGDVVEELVAKLVYRHPHVFGSVTVSGAPEVVANWEALKHDQKRRVSLADGIPKDLPALLYAHKVQRRLSGAGRGYGPSPERLAAMAVALGQAAVASGQAAAGPEPGADEAGAGGAPAVGAGPAPGDGGGARPADAAIGALLYEVVALAQAAGVDPEGALRRKATRELGTN